MKNCSDQRLGTDLEKAVRIDLSILSYKLSDRYGKNMDRKMKKGEKIKKLLIKIKNIYYDIRLIGINSLNIRID